MSLSPAGQGITELTLSPPGYELILWLSGIKANTEICIATEIPIPDLSLNGSSSSEQVCTNGRGGSPIPLSFLVQGEHPGTRAGYLDISVEAESHSIPLQITVEAITSPAGPLQISGPASFQFVRNPFGKSTIELPLVLFREHEAIVNPRFGIVDATPGFLDGRNWILKEDGVANSTGSSKSLILQAQNMGAGSHTGTFWFADGTLNPSQGIEKEFQVSISHHWLLPFMVVVVSLLLSTSITTFSSSKLEQSRLLQRLEDCQAKLNELTTAAKWFPAVRAGAHISLTRRIASRFFSMFREKEVLENRVGNAEFVVNAIHQIQDIVDEIESDTVMSQSQKLRALEEIRMMIFRLPVNDPSDKLEAIWAGRIKTLSEWTDTEKRLSRASKKLEHVAKPLAKSVNIKSVNDLDWQSLVKPLKETVLTGDFSDSSKVEELEQAYQKLLLLNTWRYDTEIREKLIQDIDASNDISAVFETVDSVVWGRMKDNWQKFRVETDLPGCPEALTPIRFTVVCSDPAINNSYVFRQKALYTWSITSQDDPEFRLLVKTTQPRVVQYLPHKGNFDLNVTISYDDDSEYISIQEDIVVTKSNTLAINKANNKTSLVNFIVSFFLACIGAMIYAYVDQDSFGTLRDYLVLFLIGAGANQAKQFLRIDLPSPARA